MKTPTQLVASRRRAIEELVDIGVDCRIEGAVAGEVASKVARNSLRNLGWRWRTLVVVSFGHFDNTVASSNECATEREKKQSCRWGGWSEVERFLCALSTRQPPVGAGISSSKTFHVSIS